MKKFLTVLLALSVVFTYSFSAVGAVFADSTEFNANVNAAEATVKSQLDSVYSDVVKNLVAKDTDGGVNADAAAWKVAAKAVYDAKIADMKKKTNDIKKDESTYGSNTVTELVAVYNVPTYADFNTAVYAENDAAARAYFPTAKAEAIAKINTVDLNAFSKSSPAEGKTYYEQVKEIIDALLEKVNAVTVANDAEDADVATAIGNIQTELGKVIEEIQDAAGKGTGKYKLTDIAKGDILTIEEEAAAALTLDAKKKAFKAQMNANVANYMATVATDTPAVISAAKEYVAAYEKAVTYQIESLTADAAKAYTVPVIDAVADKYVANLNKFAELETYAAKYKLEKDANGNLVRDAAKVDKVVADAKKDAYKADEWDDVALEAAKAKILSNCNVDPAKTTKAVEMKKAAIKTARESALENYYAAEQAAVNKVYDKMVADVDAAKTDEELKTIDPTAADLTKIDNKTAVDNKTKTSVAYAALLDKIKAYEAMQNAGASDANKKDFTVLNGTSDANWVTFVGESGARTEAEIAALYPQATAKVDAVMTAYQVAVAKDAVEKKIDALPKTITLADKAVVEAAWKAAKEYKDATGKDDIANEATLNLDIKTLAAAEKKAVEDAIAALPNTLTINDKAAVKAAKELMDAYNKATATGALYEGSTTVNDTLTAMLNTIKDLEKKAVEDAINMLPLNVALGDKAAVEAARAAYDAYVAEYTDYAAGVDASDDITNKDELFKAEAGIEALAKAEIEKQIKAVESFKIKVTTKRYTGSKMRINWTATGDESAIDGYRVYYSTKKSNSGYKYLTKTTKKYINHTSIKKNVKKGTRVYYRVRAYVEIDGVRYFSDYSTVGNRIWK